MQEFKVITLGDSGVGKTAIIKRFESDTFTIEDLVTMGIAFSFKEVTLKNRKKIRLKIIDTAGQEKYRAISKSYYKNAQGVLFVFSYDKKESFDNIEGWLNSFKEQVNDKGIPLFLVGNKYDIKDEKKVIEEDLIEDLKNRIGIKDYKNTSAKDNIGINELFNELAEKMYNQSIDNNEIKQNSIKLTSENEIIKKKRQKGCQLCENPDT